MRFLILTLSILLIFLVPIEVSAAILSISKPFGGKVLTIIPCPCSGNSMVIIGPPLGGVFTMDWGTKLYANYKPLPGHWVLGLARTYSTCLVPILVGCAPIGGGPRIWMMGTS